jgi:hypothetical protein
MAKKLTNMQATRAYVENMQKEIDLLRKTLSETLDYAGGSDLPADHPLGKAWEVRRKYEERAPK